MSARKLSNILIALYREFLQKAGCKYIRTNNGHEVWARPALVKPVIFQTHIDPVPEFVIRNAMKI